MGIQLDLEYFVEPTKNDYDFYNDIKNEVFEEIFALTHLKHSFITKGYCPEYDVLDTDTGKTYEVKRDYWWVITDNVLVEEYFNLEQKYKGWIFETTADYLVVFITDSIYYITNMYKIKADFFNNIETWSCSDIEQTKDKDGNILEKPFTTRNWLKNHNSFYCNFFKVNPNILSSFNIDTY